MGPAHFNNVPPLTTLDLPAQFSSSIIMRHAPGAVEQPGTCDAGP